jgi:hypothetical protein
MQRLIKFDRIAGLPAIEKRGSGTALPAHPR